MISQHSMSFWFLFWISWKSICEPGRLPALYCLCIRKVKGLTLHWGSGGQVHPDVWSNSREGTLCSSSQAPWLFALEAHGPLPSPWRVQGCARRIFWNTVSWTLVHFIIQTVHGIYLKPAGLSGERILNKGHHDFFDTIRVVCFLWPDWDELFFSEEPSERDPKDRLLCAGKGEAQNSLRCPWELNLYWGRQDEDKINPQK